MKLIIECLNAPFWLRGHFLFSTFYDIALFEINKTLRIKCLGKNSFTFQPNSIIMRIFKTTLLAVSLLFLSCSGDVETPESGQRSAYQKDKSLTDAEVTALTNEAQSFNTDQTYLSMTAKANELVTKMNHAQADFSTRANLETWLESNLSLTFFETKQDCLDMFDELADKAEDFLVAKEPFFKELANATDQQAAVILRPIGNIPPPTVPADDCGGACIDFAHSAIMSSYTNYVSYVKVVKSSTAPIETKNFWLASALSSHNSLIDFQLEILNNCLDDCEK